MLEAEAAAFGCVRAGRVWYLQRKGCWVAELSEGGAWAAGESDAVSHLLRIVDFAPCGEDAPVSELGSNGEERVGSFDSDMCDTTCSSVCFATMFEFAKGFGVLCPEAVGFLSWEGGESGECDLVAAG